MHIGDSGKTKDAKHQLEYNSTASSKTGYGGESVDIRRGKHGILINSEPGDRELKKSESSQDLRDRRGCSANLCEREARPKY